MKSNIILYTITKIYSRTTKISLYHSHESKLDRDHEVGEYHILLIQTIDVKSQLQKNQKFNSIEFRRRLP